VTPSTVQGESACLHQQPTCVQEDVASNRRQQCTER